MARTYFKKIGLPTRLGQFMSDKLGEERKNHRLTAIYDELEKDEPRIWFLLRQLGDINHKFDVCGSTIAHKLMHCPTVEKLRLFHKAGLNLDARNNYGVTPLSMACYKVHMRNKHTDEQRDIVRFLASAGYIDFGAGDKELLSKELVDLHEATRSKTKPQRTVAR